MELGDYLWYVSLAHKIYTDTGGNNCYFGAGRFQNGQSIDQGNMPVRRAIGIS
jgi:hypothetical protein